jgi:hypothetical protein
MDLREVRRYLHTPSNRSAIQRATGLRRRTMRRDRPWAATPGLLDPPWPPVEVLPQSVSTTLELPPPPPPGAAVAPCRALGGQLDRDGVAGTALLPR